MKWVPTDEVDIGVSGNFIYTDIPYDGTVIRILASEKAILRYVDQYKKAIAKLRQVPAQEIIAIMEAKDTKEEIKPQRKGPNLPLQSR